VLKVPSLLVTYGVANDFFFSGHTALAVFGAIEVGRVRRWLIPLAAALAVFEATTVLALRALWTMDVFTGAVTAVMVGLVCGPVAGWVDRAIGKVAPGRAVSGRGAGAGG
jgi:hypothetical protein